MRETVFLVRNKEDRKCGATEEVPTEEVFRDFWNFFVDIAVLGPIFAEEAKIGPFAAKRGKKIQTPFCRRLLVESMLLSELHRQNQHSFAFRR